MPVRKPASIKLYSAELIDPGTECHYAFHTSFRDITVVHTHNFFELFLIVRGEVVHRVNGRAQLLPEGTLVFMRPSDIHCYQPGGASKCQLINLAFRESTLAELFRYLGPGFPSERLVHRTQPPAAVLSRSETDLLTAKLTHLNTIPRDQKLRVRSALRVLLFEIFTRYFAAQEDDTARHLPPWLEALLTELQKKENFVRGVDSIYALSKLTPEHISRVFRKHLGTTPTAYLAELRLNYAANLLAGSDESIAYISLEAGFDNVSHFYHLFKKKFRVPPAEFRRATQKAAIPVRARPSRSRAEGTRRLPWRARA